MSDNKPVAVNAEALLRSGSLSDEFKCDLGDKRRTARLVRLAMAMAKEPAKSFPSLSNSPAEQEAVYRFLSNDSVTFEAIFDAHRTATAERARELGEVLVVHDTTAFMFPRHDGHTRRWLEAKSKGRQGYYGHFGIVATSDGHRAPLGAVSFEGYVHDSQVDEETRHFWAERFPVRESEGERWLAGMKAAEKALEGCRVIHVADREGDRNDVLRWGTEMRDERGFVVRATRVARDASGATVDDLLKGCPTMGTRTVTLNSRSLQGVPARSKTQPERPRRQAKLSFRACTVQLKPKDGAPITLNVVEAVELKAPKGQEPIRWVLFTGEPIETLQDVLRIVDIYRSRWLIEEFFKAIKTGCDYSSRQLDSAKTLLIALALALPMAWQLLAVRHLSRHDTDVPARTILTPLQLQLLKLQFPKLKWSRNPTVSQATKAIGHLGGHHRSKGHPGWQTLGHGTRSLPHAPSRHGCGRGRDVINHEPAGGLPPPFGAPTPLLRSYGRKLPPSLRRSGPSDGVGCGLNTRRGFASNRGLAATHAGSAADRHGGPDRQRGPIDAVLQTALSLAADRR